jgi:hypothetical protein
LQPTLPKTSNNSQPTAIIAPNESQAVTNSNQENQGIHQTDLQIATNSTNTANNSQSTAIISPNETQTVTNLLTNIPSQPPPNSSQTNMQTNNPNQPTMESSQLNLEIKRQA